MQNVQLLWVGGNTRKTGLILPISELEKVWQLYYCVSNLNQLPSRVIVGTSWTDKPTDVAKWFQMFWKWFRPRNPRPYQMTCSPCSSKVGGIKIFDVGPLYKSTLPSYFGIDLVPIFNKVSSNLKILSLCGRFIS